MVPALQAAGVSTGKKMTTWMKREMRIRERDDGMTEEAIGQTSVAALGMVHLIDIGSTTLKLSEFCRSFRCCMTSAVENSSANAWSQNKL